MSEFTITKENTIHASTVVDNAFITGFLPALSGDAVKVYLYGLMLCSSSDRNSTDIETALGMSKESVLDSFRILSANGLVRLVESGFIHVQYLNANEIITEQPLAGGRYSDLIKSLQSVLGTRSLSGSELQKIYDWIEIFHFEPDAATEIVRHSIEIKGAKVNINYMDAIAKRFAAERFLTYDQVHEAFVIETNSMTGAAAILKRWNISRRPTEDEFELYNKWKNEWKFNDEVINLACREVVSSDRPTFRYLDAILQSYHEHGCVSPESIRQLSREQDLIFDIAQQILSRCGLSSRRSTVEQRQQVELWYKQWRMDPEMMYYAAELSSGSTRPFADTKKKLKQWHEIGIGTLNAAKEYVAKHQSSYTTDNQKKRINRALNYKQHNYTAEQLAELGIDFGEDIYEN